jgi:hypothetical protein
MADLVLNGSFEADFTYWDRSTDDETRIRVSNDSPHSGGNCVEFRWRSTLRRPVYVEQQIDFGLLCAGGYLSFWLRSGEGGFGTLRVDIDYAIGEDDGAEFECEDEWTRCSMRVRHLLNLTKIRFSPLSSAPMRLDDVSLRPWMGLRVFEPLPFPGIDPFPWPPRHEDPSSPAKSHRPGAEGDADTIDVERRLAAIEKEVFLARREEKGARRARPKAKDG